MNCTEFPGCCGYRCITGFHAAKGDLPNLTKKLDECIREWWGGFPKKDIYGNDSIARVRHGILVALTGPQVQLWGEILRERGFTLISDCPNPHHASRNYLFILTKDKDDLRVKTKLKFMEGGKAKLISEG